MCKMSPEYLVVPETKKVLKRINSERDVSKKKIQESIETAPNDHSCNNLSNKVNKYSIIK